MEKQCIKQTKKKEKSTLFLLKCDAVNPTMQSFIESKLDPLGKVYSQCTLTCWA